MSTYLKARSLLDSQSQNFLSDFGPHLFPDLQTKFLITFSFLISISMSRWYWQDKGHLSVQTLASETWPSIISSSPKHCSESLSLL
jgi:hypothetical protein